MNEIIQNFQFIRPEWLWLIAPILLGYLLKLKYGKDQNVWQQIIPKHLYQQMIIKKGIHKSNRFLHIGVVGLLLSAFAIAGPSWEKLPQAVYQTQMGKVILMDMSMSMRATDLSPDRLTRARFKAIDLVNEVKEGETGLVAYSGDAFVVSPLTDDINNLKTLIPVLSPEIMPSQGSVAITGLEQAAALLENAGYQLGQIYWITDGISFDEVKEVRNFISASNYDISALLIGTEEGAPITMQDGQLLKDFKGQIVIPSINARYMNQAMAGTGADYHLFATDNSDIEAIQVKIEFEQQQQAEAVKNTTGDELKDMGPFLVLLLLPLAAYTFRKGLLSIALTSILSVLLLMPNKDVYAQVQNAGQQDVPQVTLANPNSRPESLLDRAFKNADQRGKLAFDNSDYEKANDLFENDEWRAASAYKLGDYERAAKLYNSLIESQQSPSADNRYNYGNALAKTGKLEEALDAYTQALELDGEHEQAIKNKKIIEDLLKQQESNEQSSDENNEQQDQEGNEQEQSEQSNSQQEKSDSDNNNDDSEQSEQGEQDSEQQSSGNSEQQEQQNNDDALKENAQQQQEQESQSEQQEGSQSQRAQAEQDDENQELNEQQAAISNQLNEDELSPEEKEEMQRMQMILNKVTDDPAYLLKRKMLLEAYKRKTSPPPPEQENW